jgi:ATP-binding cassette subfamily B protein
MNPGPGDRFHRFRLGGSSYGGSAEMRTLRSDLTWALSYVRPYAARLVVVGLASLAGTALSLILPYLSKGLVDEALLGRNPSALFRIVGAFVGVTALSFVLNVVSGLRYTRVSADILFDMRLDLYRHLQRLSPRFYARTPLGEIVSRINGDIGEIQRVAAETALAWLGNILFLLGTVGMLMWLDLRLFLVSLAVLPPSLWALVRYRRKLETAVADLRHRSSDIGSFLIETLQGMKLVVASNAQEREVARFRRKNDAFIESLMSMRWLGYMAGGLPGLILTAGTAVVFLYGGSRVIGGAITFGTFVAFMAYQMRLTAPVQALMGLYTNVATARVSLHRVREILDAPVEVHEHASPRSLPAVRGELVFENVTLSHGRGGPALEDVSFTVDPGQVVAIVGPSGSGKSTVADLIARHLDPDSGRILLDGTTLDAIRLAELRSAIVCVDQDPFVLHASVAENVRYARPDATVAEITEAVRAAGLEGFVADLPDGLDTVVGERGREVSAGERQRIALARAFLADPAVLVMDEATGALDPASERLVVEGWAAIMAGRTTVLVTHRPELARSADLVVVLEQGRVREVGSPAQLLERPGTFRALFGKGNVTESRAAP